MVQRGRHRQRWRIKILPTPFLTRDEELARQDFCTQYRAVLSSISFAFGSFLISALSVSSSSSSSFDRWAELGRTKMHATCLLARLILSVPSGGVRSFGGLVYVDASLLPEEERAITREHNQSLRSGRGGMRLGHEEAASSTVQNGPSASLPLPRSTIALGDLELKRSMSYFSVVRVNERRCTVPRAK